MKRFFLFLLTASLVQAQTFPVKVDESGNVLHYILVQPITNPTGVVNFETGKLLINGAPVGGGGSGTVTSFSAGDLSPLFTTTETTVTTTPVLSFTLSIAPANSFFGNGTGSPAVPTFMSASTAKTTLAITFTDLVSHPTDLGGYGILDAQPLNTNLTTWANVIRTGAFDIFAATPTIANFNTLLSDADVPPTTRTISTTVPLTGGGDLSANRTLAINDAAADGSTKGAATFTASDFNATSGNISLDYVNGQKATSSLPGFLSAADWTTFNAKGTVTSFSAGDLSPLFTTTESTVTTTPALSFVLSTAGANTFFGNGTGSTTVPTFMSAATALTSIGAQPLDGDLTSIGAISSNNAIPFRATPNTWGTVKYGAGIQFVNGILSTVANQAQLIPEATKSSASTLNVSGETATNYDVTGIINISAITLEEGRTVLLRFTGAGLNLIYSSSLLLPGNASILTDSNSWGLFLGGATGVVICVEFHKAAPFTTEGAFENVYTGRLKPRNAAESLWMDLSSGPDSIAWVKSDGSGFILWDMGHLTGTKTWTMPNVEGALAVVETDFASVIPRFHAIGSSNHLYEFPDQDGTVAMSPIGTSQLSDTSVTLAKMANMATASVLYRKSSGSGVPEVNSLATLKTDLGLIGTNSGDQTITLTGDVTGSGTGSFATTVAAISGAFNLTGDITPPTLSPTGENNYAPTGFSTASTLRLTPGSGGTTITGLAGGADGRMICLHNISSGSDLISLGALDPSSSAANQFSSAVDLNPGDSVFLRYDATSLLWRPCVPHIDLGALTIPWGNIGGTLSDQSDLQSALNLKVTIDANANSASNNFISGYTTTATAAGTTTLTVASAQTQYFTGSTTQTCKLPVTSTLTLGHTFRIVNNSSGAVTINSSGSNAVKVLAGGTSCVVTCILITGTTAASWDADYTATSFTTGTKMTFPTTSATIARTDAANTFTGVQTMTSPAITTPAITGLATGSGVASAATASTIATRDASASLLAQAFVASGTAPTCTGATIGTGSKNNAGFVTTSTTGVSTVVVTFSTTAPTGWAISPQNNTTANLIRQTASSTTTATFVGTTVSGDVISYLAMAY